MPRTTIAKVDEAGVLHVKLPAGVRKRLPAGSTLKLQTNGSSLCLTPVYVPGRPLTPEERERFIATINRIRKWTEQHNITAAEMKRTLKRVRQEQRAANKGRSR